VVANGAEGEPASKKDALLLSHAPHLVLDGLMLAGGALGAQQAIVYAPRASIPGVEAAVAERRSLHHDPIAVEIVESADTFISGQESAVVNALGGRRGAIPGFVGLTSIRERGVGGRPTLVQNVETLAHVALIARFGATWFRQVGTTDTPGTMLLTVHRPDGPLIIEAVLGSSLQTAAGLRSHDVARSLGVLLGGYGGGWVTPATFSELPVSETAARRAGATLGAGVVALLPPDVCPLAEMADVVRYMEGQGAGQCGPCVHGLAELADGTERLAYGGPNGPRAERLLEICQLVEGRGACRHPDGVARFVRTGLQAFSDEVLSHQRRGCCPRTHAARVLPVADRTARRRLVSRA
jgi:NADH:ubiquinone oxidoreductase subunit F (NADH-binding)